MLKNWLAVCVGELPSVTERLKKYCPKTVGVPLTSPVLESSESPGGRACPLGIVNEYGVVPPNATTLAVNGRFTEILNGSEFWSVNNGAVTVMVNGCEAVSGGE